jgi:hypothetical protein
MTPAEFDFEATPSAVAGLNRKELEAHLVETRAKLTSNLDALEVKFDIPHQLDKAGRRLRRKVRTMRQDNPIALAGILLGGVAAVGITAYIAVKIATSKK